MNIPKGSNSINHVSFSGHTRKIDKSGYEIQRFYYLFDPRKYECELELYNVEKDKNGN